MQVDFDRRGIKPLSCITNFKFGSIPSPVHVGWSRAQSSARLAPFDRRPGGVRRRSRHFGAPSNPGFPLHPRSLAALTDNLDGKLRCA